MRLVGHDINPRRSAKIVLGGGQKSGNFASSALKTHVSYIPGLSTTAVVRSATVEDRVSVARLMVREKTSDAALDKRQRQERVRETLSALRDMHTIIHVVELEGRLCSAVLLRPATASRIFASAALINEAGRAFDAALALRMMEHAVQCCHADGWTHLRYLADLAAPQVVCGFFRWLGYDCAVEEAQIGLGERLRFGRRSHELRFAFTERKRGPDESDPRIVWF